MNTRFEWTLACLAFVVVLGGGTVPVLAAPRVGTTQLGVDVVTLQDGSRVLGMITKADRRSLVMAVRRAWLEAELPERLAALERRDDAAAEREREQARERLAAWQRERADRPALAKFLAAEGERLAKLADAERDKADEERSEFLLLTLTADEVKRVYRQTPLRRQAALLAWRERLKDVENRRADELVRTLKKQGVEPPRGPVDLSDRFPKSATTEGTPFEARVAAVEYRYVEALDFQGTGDLLVRTTGREGAGVGLAEVLNAFTKSVKPQNLLDLIDPPVGGGRAGSKPAAKPSFDTAIKEAEKRGLRGFRVTRVEPQLDRQRVTVESLFVAKLPGGWQPVWRNVKTLDASKARPELEQRIAEDERVAELFKTIRALGVGGEGPLKTALRFGAATMEAQTAGGDAFYEFIEAAGGSLDAAWPTGTTP